MELDGIEIVKKLLKEKHIVLRERTPIDTMLYAIFPYLDGLLLKGVKTRLLTTDRSRTAPGKNQNSFQYFFEHYNTTQQNSYVISYS